jgi:hypothetical protein
MSMDKDYRCYKSESTLHGVDPVHDATGQSQLNIVILKIYKQYCPFNLGSTLQGTWNKHDIMSQFEESCRKKTIIITGVNDG